jgi:hypothetical protein
MEITMAKSKKELDKDLLYKKLMPSNYKVAKASAEESSADAASTSLVDTPAQTAEKDTVVEPLHNARPIFPRDVSISLTNNQPTVVVNVMEKLVIDKFDTAIIKFKCCKCDRCKKDIMALALNKLPPKYVVLNKGEETPEPDEQTKAQVITALIQAILKVRAQPRH